MGNSAVMNMATTWIKTNKLFQNQAGKKSRNASKLTNWQGFQHLSYRIRANFVYA